ncbi:hypothetical protein ACK8OR_13715 [Jannaschia sp. KMU-145]|uniref:hypothetical protein n=1 Tax=Jannaschia halovivens TaxID=3388667 RepID=UPI00396AF296
MKNIRAAAAAALLASAAAAQDAPTFSGDAINPASFVLIDGDGPNAFDRDAWIDAVAQSEGQVLAVRLRTEPRPFDAAAAAAQEAGVVENTVTLETVNVPAEKSTAFARSRARMDEVMLEENAAMGWRLAVELPMCALYHREAGPDERAPSALLAVMDEDYAQLFCYRTAIAYYASRRDETGARTPPIYIDAQTITMQEMMPPIGVHSAYLAHKDRRDDRGRYLARESNVYAPNEEIFLRAYLEHVARSAPGTMDMRFEIDLHLRVADESGAELGRAKLHTYAAPSTLLYPVDETQFWNNITAGMSLPDPGRYELTFIFTDMTRAGTPSAEVSFPVVIDAASEPQGRVQGSE